MTELEKAVMASEVEDEIKEMVGEVEISEPDDAVQESFEEVERMKKEIEAENNQLNISFSEIRANPAPVPRKRYHYIGTFSAAASLVLMGIAMTFSLFSPTGILASLKFAPLMLVFLGLEIGFAMLRNRSMRIRYNVKSLVLTFLLILVSFIMLIISVTNSVTGGERHYAEERLRNMLGREISREISNEIIKNVDIQIHLYGNDPSVYENINDLEDSDVIDLEIQYINAQMTMYEFAANCRKTMDSLSKMPYNFGTVAFTANDDINSYSMEINWLYQSGFSSTELIPLVNYFGNDIVMDIPDLVDD